MLQSQALLVCDTEAEPCEELVNRLGRAGYQVIVHDAPGYEGLDFSSPRLYWKDRTATGVEGIEHLAAMLEAESAEQHHALVAQAVDELSSISMLDEGAAAGLVGGARLDDATKSGLLVVLRDPIRFPEFQFDSERGDLRPVVEEANLLLDAANDPYGALSWWETPNENLDGSRPMDMVGTSDDSLITTLKGWMQFTG